MELSRLRISTRNYVLVSRSNFVVIILNTCLPNASDSTVVKIPMQACASAAYKCEFWVEDKQCFCRGEEIWCDVTERCY